MHPAFQIESKLRAYLSREMSVDDLRRWFATMRGPLLALPADLPAARLTTILELGLIELKDGTLSQRQLRKLLKESLERSPQFTVQDLADLEITSSDSVTSTAVGTFDVSGPASPHQTILVGTSP